jgi:hypothetical protein
MQEDIAASRLGLFTLRHAQSCSVGFFFLWGLAARAPFTRIMMSNPYILLNVAFLALLSLRLRTPTGFSTPQST